MPGCVLRVTGTAFDPDGFLATSSLEPCTVWRRGEVSRRSLTEGGGSNTTSGLCCDVSRSDGDLDTEVQDAIEFLVRHESDLLGLGRDKAVEDAFLDFGFFCRVGQNNVFMQGEFLPVDLLRLAGRLGLGIALSIYPAPEEDV